MDERSFEIVIAAMNAENTIGETLESLLGSTVQPKRIWVIDDESSDRTAEVAASYDKVTVLKNEQNRDTSYSRNRGIKRVKTPFLYIIDADDIVKEDKFEKDLTYLDKHPEADAVFGDKVSFLEKFERDRIEQAITYEKMEDLMKLLLRKNTIVPSMVFFRKRYFEKFGLFDEDIHITNDRELYLRGILNGAEIHYNPGSILYYRRHGSSMLATRYREGIYQNYIALCKHFENLRDFKNGRYKNDLANSLRMMARNLNIYGFPFELVKECITKAKSAHDTYEIDQNRIYKGLDRVLGPELTERLLRPKFKLDHLLGRYS